MADQAAQRGCRASLLLLLLLLLPVGGTLTRKEADALCSQYGELFSNIPVNLERWREKGIDMNLMRKTIAKHTTRTQAEKGFAAAFIKGKAFLMDKPVLAPWVGHHVGLNVIYMKLLLFLEETFGDLIPDVEFVINTGDTARMLAPEGVTGEPVMRFCKGDLHAAILIPIYHFFMVGFVEMIRQIPSINSEYPWETKKEVLFGRFTFYDRSLVMGDHTTFRLGSQGANICTTGTRRTNCPVREHFVEFAKDHQDLMDVAASPHIPMKRHAAWKYLLHLDGQGLSSRLEQLLPMNSLVFKEESGFTGFYHHMLRPYEHYIPFWNKTPDDIIPALQWAKANDGEARRIARNAQEFAKKYLVPEARHCFWLHLLTEYSKLLTYKPGPSPERRRRLASYWRPIREFLEDDVAKYEGGRWLSKWAFTP